MRSSPLVFATYLIPIVAAMSTYLSESWAMLSGRPAESSCVPIPRNFSLCHGIDYSKMRLPNLLDHETMFEATEQSKAWVTLTKLECHPDTQLFLCSLFAPVCLDRTIYPCRSLCEAVKRGCASRMLNYGFQWPEMLKCDKFPLAHDMCIQPRSQYGKVNSSCHSCKQVGTYENILDNFCRSTYVLKVKVNSVEPSFIRVKRGRVVKPQTGLNQDEIRNIRLLYSEDNQNCPCEIAIDRKRSKKPYLVMANKNSHGDYIMNLILPWKKEKPFKRAVRMFRKLDCSALGKTIRERATVQTQDRNRRFGKKNPQGTQSSLADKLMLKSGPKLIGF